MRKSFKAPRGMNHRPARQGPKKVLARAKGKPLSSLTRRQLKAVSNRNPSSKRVRNARRLMGR